MSLTNSVVQICSLELLFPGLGLLITPALALIGAFVFFGAQILYTKWWFDRYRIGPAEWLWRSASYGKVQRFRGSSVPGF
ncbi:MAG TPA: DUF418 domain-containing protein [Vicinamibacterales bacterium]|nr:DUF418 domain-containing protein [Vicinamibacterales bacterium]